jgi:hypothetical protein
MPDEALPDWPGAWAPLPADDWAATRDTLHRWTQIVGKVRMAYAPPVNHWWHVTLYLGARGLTTGLMPGPTGGFELAFDFVDHRLVIERVDGAARSVALEPRSVADFHAETMARLAELGIEPRILARPVEVEDATPFADDTHHAAYDAVAARHCWANMVDAHRVLSRFRAGFTGKVSPVHFFWGAFDVAVTRFSGRPAPLHPGGAPNCADWVMEEAYSREVSSAGWWPAGGAAGIFYSYAYPEPDGYAAESVAPAAARYDGDLREFVLPYEAAAAAADPDGAVAEFLGSTFAAAATRGRWDPDG